MEFKHDLKHIALYAQKWLKTVCDWHAIFLFIYKTFTTVTYWRKERLEKYWNWMKNISKKHFWPLNLNYWFSETCDQILTEYTVHISINFVLCLIISFLLLCSCFVHFVDNKIKPIYCFLMIFTRLLFFDVFFYPDFFCTYTYDIMTLY